MRCGCLAEVSVREVHVDAPAVSAVSVPRIVCPVEEVENLKPELEIYSLRDAVVFVEVDVGLDKVWSAELHSLLISVLTKRGDGEIALGNRSTEPSAVRG